MKTIAGIFSKKLFKISHLAIFLQSQIQLRNFHGQFSQPVTKIAGWGKRDTSLKARTYAKRQQLPYLALEDGFLRSVELGKKSPPLSLVQDEKGIYYDASNPSSLESLIPQHLDNKQIKRTNTLLELWKQGRVSKYNHLREYSQPLPSSYVLVVDQTFGDISVELGLANAESFQKMLIAALAENPTDTVLIKTHPDVLAGYKKGYFSLEKLSKQARVKILAENVHPVRLIEEAKVVYTVTSQMGFEALLWGKPVRTFGMPFYAGWGLTQDELESPARCKALLGFNSLSLQQLIYAALIAYPRYINPETKQLCEVEDTLEYIAWQREQRHHYPSILYALKFSRWKKPLVRGFFQGSEIRFISNLKQVPNGATLIVWGVRLQSEVELKTRNINLLRLEDGFLRSVGLGADLIKPLSWVIDSRGLYYDASCISDLEQILQNRVFSKELITRAELLRLNIVKHELTKYNVAKVSGSAKDGEIFPSDELITAQKQTLKIILVTGQVESDASIAKGATDISSNIGLLKAVKADNPKAYILYKPHPDVLSGLRKKGQQEDETYHYCDELISHVSIAKVLGQIDEVHVLTSLAGFEALLRGKKVTCYGSPFYSGWGLTTDVNPLSRRTRKLNLDELVAGTLILYPRYVSRLTGYFTTPEHALDELLSWRKAENNYLSWWRKLFRVWLRLLAT